MSKGDYIKTDRLGFPYNGKYPPKGDRLGLYHGYSSDVEETLLYDFAVQGYDLTFIYKGERYCFLSAADHVAHCDDRYTVEYETFPDANTALEQFRIDGRPIIELIGELEDVEPV